MAKSMIVTLPFTLLLLDVWPLRRANRLAVIWEKLPLIGLAGGVSLHHPTFRRNRGTPSNRSLPCPSACGLKTPR